MPSFRTKHTSPSMMQLSKPRATARQLWEGMAVVVAVAGAEGGCSVLHSDLEPPAVQLDLVDPIGTVRRTFDEQAGRERDEVGKSASGASPPFLRADFRAAPFRLAAFFLAALRLVFGRGRSPLSPWPDLTLVLARFLRSAASDRPTSSDSTNDVPSLLRRTYLLSVPVSISSRLAMVSPICG